MEKFYMNDNNFNDNGQQKQSQKGKYHFSIVLSFVVAVMAIASLVVVGFDQISYAASTPLEADSFTFYSGTKRIIVGNFSVPMYYADSAHTKPIFCIQHMIEPGIGENYSIGDEINDNGILYILNKSAIYDGGTGIIAKSDIGTNVSDELYDTMETYATQVALWLYLYRAGDSENDLKTTPTSGNAISGETNKSSIENATTYSIQVIGGGADDATTVTDSNKKIAAKIKNVVNAAKTSSNIKTLNVAFADKSLSEVNGTDYYQTSAINIVGNPSNDLESFSISVSGVDGAFFVDENGEKITNLDYIVPNSKKLYVRVPKDKVTSESQTLKVTANGTFKNYLSGRKYVHTGYQTVVAVTNTIKW